MTALGLISSWKQNVSQSVKLPESESTSNDLLMHDDKALLRKQCESSKKIAELWN